MAVALPRDAGDPDMNAPNIGADIGVDIDDLNLPPKDALRQASDLGFLSVELSTSSQELEPTNLSTSGRRHLLKYTDGLGLRMRAITADLPRLRLTDPGTVDERVERTRRIFDLARDVNVGVVTASSGALTHPETGEPSPLAIQALTQIGEYADACGIVYALRPSRDGVDRVDGVLKKIACPSIRIGLDPAGMVMAGANPLSLIQQFPEDIALLHVRDGVAGLPDRPGSETRFGEGEVDFVSLMALLSAVEFNGPCILRRTDSTNPAADLTLARDALRRLLPPV